MSIPVKLRAMADAARIGEVTPPPDLFTAAAAEIDRLQEAKRRFSDLADERGKECNALRQENERLRQVEGMARYVLETFTKDEAQGYRSRDRQFAIELLGKFLTAEQPPQAFVEAKAERDAGWPRDFEQEGDGK